MPVFPFQITETCLQLQYVEIRELLFIVLRLP